MSITSISPVTQFLQAQKNEASAAATYAKTDILTQRETSTFTKDASSITSADELMKNYSSLQVVLGAYGLGSISNQTALIKKLLTQDPSSSTSLAKSSGNAQWLAFADAFKTMGENGGTATTSPFTSDVISSVTTKYQETQFEQSKQNTKNGVGNALYFARTMTGATTLTGIMSDSKLLKVVETVSGFDPDTFGALDYDQQVRMLSNKVNLSDFSSPDKIQKYAEKYLTMLQITPQTTDEPASLLDLFGGDDSDDGILALFGGDDSSSSGGIYSSLF